MLPKTTKTTRCCLPVLAVGLVLLGGCSDNEIEERRGSIYDWQHDPTPENQTLIRGLLADPNRDIRATALNVLVGLRVPDAEELSRSGLEDEDGFVRSIAAKLLGDLGSVESVELLVRQLQEDPDPRARQTSAEALTVLGGEQALVGLMQGLTDPMKEVRLAVVRGVRELGPSRATAAIARLLLEDPDWEIRVQAAGALGAAGDRQMVPVLLRALEDENDFVRSAAANALKGLGEDIPAGATQRSSTG